MTMTRHAPWIVWTGLGVVLAAAAILSFDALRHLAMAVSIPEHLAWLLPIAVDAGAAVSCATWLSRRAPKDAARFAAWMTWALLAFTIVGNAGQLGMHAHDVVPPWWVAVLVGAVPPIVVGGCVHLAVLVARNPVERVSTPTREPVARVSTPTPAAEKPERVEAEKPERSDEDLLHAVRQLADRNGKRPGRNLVARELGVGAGRATRLLEEFDRTGPRRTA